MWVEPPCTAQEEEEEKEVVKEIRKFMKVKGTGQDWEGQ